MSQIDYILNKLLRSFWIAFLGFFTIGL